MKTMHKQLTTLTLGAIGGLAAIGFAPFDSPVNAQTLSPTPIPVSRGTLYPQNFDNTSGTTSNGTTATLPTGWGQNLPTYTLNDGSSTTLGIYSYGDANGGSRTDRAIGSFGSSSNIFGAVFQIANGSQSVGGLLISYTGERWRTGTGSDRLDFQYSTNATNLTSGTWQDANLLDFTVAASALAGNVDGNLAANRSTISSRITFASLNAGSNVWIRWVDSAASGGSESGLAVDDLSVTAEVPEPTTILGGMAALGIGRAVQRKWQRGRKKTAAAKA